jgi:hypothetical protein
VKTIVSPKVAATLRRLGVPGVRVRGELSAKTTTGAQTSADSTLRGGNSYYGRDGIPVVPDQLKSEDVTPERTKTHGNVIEGARHSGNAKPE